jgi:hypothetical protein
MLKLRLSRTSCIAARVARPALLPWTLSNCRKRAILAAAMLQRQPLSVGGA